MNSSLLKKIAVICTGHAANLIINNVFDYLIYVPVIALFGPYMGCYLMTGLSFLLNVSLISLYDMAGKDLLGFESLKKVKEKPEAKLPWYLRILASKGGEIGAFLALSFYDPFLAVIYMRKAEQAYKGLSPRDAKIFIFSTILSNGFWTGLISGGLLLWQWGVQPFLEWIKTAFLS